MRVRLSKIDKGELLFITNPQYGDLIKRYQHLRSVDMVRRANYQYMSSSAVVITRELRPLRNLLSDKMVSRLQKASNLDGQSLVLGSNLTGKR
jgi:hypothetical protein